MHTRLLVPLFLLGNALGSGAQEKHSMAADPTCRCRIVLRRVATLGHENDTISLVEQSSVVKDSRGQFYVAPVLPYGAVAVYDRTGQFKSMVGRRGAGPGELNRIRDVVVTPGDSLIAYDENRVVMFAPDGEHVRTVNVESGPHGFRFVVLGGGVLVINNYFPTQPAFILLDRDFKSVRKFGRSVHGDRLASDALQFVIADIGNGQFVAVQQNHRFGLQVWDTAGRMIRAIDRQPDWFPPWTQADRTRVGFGPLPVVLGVHYEQSHERVWIVASVPDPNWKPPTPPRGAFGGEGGGYGITPVPLRDRAKDTVIELLDLRSGRVLVSQRFDAWVPYVTETGLIYTHRELPGGLLVIDVYQADIVPDRSR